MKKNITKISHLFFMFALSCFYSLDSGAQNIRAQKTLRRSKNSQQTKQAKIKTLSNSKKHKKQETKKNYRDQIDQLSTDLQGLSIDAAHPTVLPGHTGPTRAKKDWNFIVYMVNNNNLHKYGVKNFKQMAKIGSTKNINLLIQMDDLGTSDITRYYIEKNNPVAIDPDTFIGSTMSGTPDNLFEFVKWAIKNYPAQQQALVLWNHGSGIKDPGMWGRVIMKCRDDFFSLNKQTGLLELNRRAIDRISDSLNEERGIGFNDETEQYITNQDLKNTLEKISKELLKGAKIDLLCMDACHMGMVEIGSQVATAVEFMTGSEEVEPGSGYNYETVLAPFTFGTLTPENFARHIVNSYESEYKNMLADYTQSAINLDKIAELEDNINNISIVIMNLLASVPSFVKTIKDIRRSSKQTTSFFDADYIDLHHFYTSLLQKTNALKTIAQDVKQNMLQNIQEQKEQEENKQIKEITHEITKTGSSDLLQELSELLTEGINHLELTIIENVCGSGLPKARGLSIYFPQRTPHASYQKTVFARITKWLSFVKEYQKQV